MHGTTFPPGRSPAAERHALLVLICTSAPSFMIQLDANIVSVSLPAIARSLGASFAGIEWVISAYILSFASLLLPAGALADRFGRKRLLILGVSSVMSARRNMQLIMSIRFVMSSSVGSALLLKLLSTP